MPSHACGMVGDDGVLAPGLAKELLAGGDAPVGRGWPLVAAEEYTLEVAAGDRVERPLPYGYHRTEGVTTMQLPGEPIEMVVA